MLHLKPHERTSDYSQWSRPAQGVPLPAAEAPPVRTQATSLLDDPAIAGNPVARAHARAARETHATPGGADHPIGRALLFLVVLPAILFLVSNPLGWVLLLGLCFGFAVLFGFGGIL